MKRIRLTVGKNDRVEKLVVRKEPSDVVSCRGAIKVFVSFAGVDLLVAELRGAQGTSLADQRYRNWSLALDDTLHVLVGEGLDN
jgi:hypothetical protein